MYFRPTAQYSTHYVDVDNPKLEHYSTCLRGGVGHCFNQIASMRRSDSSLQRNKYKNRYLNQ